MADNIATTPGSGATIAADDVGGILHQRVKISVGADGAAADMPMAADGLTAGVVPAGAMMYDAVANVWQRTRTARSEGNDSTGAATLLVSPALWDGTYFQKQRGNLEGTLLASAARTTTTDSAIQTNYNHRGIILTLDVSSAGTGTLTPQLLTSNGFGIVSFGTTTGDSTYVYYPGVIDTELDAVSRAGVLPRSWYLRITHSDASSWTYAVTYYLTL